MKSEPFKQRRNQTKDRVRNRNRNRGDVLGDHLDRHHWFWSIVYECKGTYGLILLAAVFINLFALVSPLFIMNVYDRVIPNNAIETGWALGIGALSLFIFDFIIRTLRGNMTDLAGRYIDVVAGQKIYAHMLNMKLKHKPRSSGVFANMLRDFDTVRDFFTSATMTGFVDLPFTLLFLFVIYQLAGGIAFLLAGLMVAVIVTGYVLQFPLKVYVRKSIQSSEAKHGLLIETIQGLETIKALNAGAYFQKIYAGHLAQNAKFGQSSRFISALGINIATFLQQIASILIVLTGMYMVRDGDLSMGGLIASVIIGGRAIAPIGQVANLMARYHQAGGALKTLDRFMEQPTETSPDKDYLRRETLRGAIAFDGVSFSYAGSEQTILKDVSFQIEAGEKVGLIGRIGSGKSTIAKILMGLQDPQEGGVLLDGTDQRQINPADIRRNIGYISQDVLLFNASVRDNITAGLSEADKEHLGDAHILDIAKKSGVHDFMARNPMGYDAMVGEQGHALSGGQRQAIALARAMILNPPILICDEPTNAMDIQAEASFMAYLKALKKDKTVVLVTHKQSLLPLVERLILIDEGRVVMDGARDEVLNALSSGKVEARS